MSATLRTSICDPRGIQHPILQSGMGRIAGPELVAEVSRVGGLGILAGLRLGNDEAGLAAGTPGRSRGVLFRHSAGRFSPGRCARYSTRNAVRSFGSIFS
jgi:hypothetical protein